MAGSLVNFAYTPANVISRHGDAFVYDGSTNWYHLGSLANLSINGEPVDQGEDTHKRLFQVAVMVTVEFAIKQTTYATEIANLDALVGEQEIFFSDCALAYTTQGELNTAVAAADGVQFQNALLRVGLQLEFGGGESSIPITFQGEIPLSEFIKIGNSTVSMITC